MDFLKIIRSFEELIFEAVIWLILYPRTLWRILVRPLATLAYSDAEQGQPEGLRYDDAISPPLLLLATALLINLAGVALHVPPPPDAERKLHLLFASPQNLVFARSLVFSIVPLVAAATVLKARGLPLARETLRGPFYAQCYLAAPCAMAAGFGGIILQRPDFPNGLALMLIGLGAVWFLSVQVRWFAQQLGQSLARAALTTLWMLVRAAGYLLVVLLPVAALLVA